MGFLGCASESYSGYTRMNNSSNMHRATMRSYVVNGKRYYPTKVSIGDYFSGMASWYGRDFHGKLTSNGERYNMYAFTAAHKILPMNTMVKVTNLRNNKTQIVRINDRGPFVKSRIIDLSYAAAKSLGYANKGTTPVRLEVVGFNGRVNSNSYSDGYSSQNVQSMSVGDFLIQLGAFRNADGSKRFAKTVQNRYAYKAVIKESYLNGSPIYRVYLRGFQSEEEAKDFIKNQNLKGAFIARGE